jgi:hypothetical protein
MDVLLRLLVVRLAGALINALAATRFRFKPTPICDLRRRAIRRNARAMQEILPLCPNCVQPMRLTRRIAADDTHHGQDVFECSTCRVAMTQGARTEPHLRASDSSYVFK